MISKSYFPKLISFALIILIILLCFLSIPNDLSTIYRVVFLIIPLAILFLFGSLRVELNKKGIHYTMFPFVNKKIAWNEIENFEIENISPLCDFLGWGFRYSPKYGWSYILDTNYAIFIVKKNGKKLALSINDKDKALEYLRTIGK